MFQELDSDASGQLDSREQVKGHEERYRIRARMSLHLVILGARELLVSSLLFSLCMMRD
jgi:hypothetical protein